MNTIEEIDPYIISQEICEGLAGKRKIMAPIRWPGGKTRMAKKILALLPAGKVYVEPYCGAASVFWHVSPYMVEVLNDLNGDIINLWRTLQDPQKFRELAHRLTWTPYSRAEFCRALKILRDNTGNDIDRAWAFFVAQNQGFSGVAKDPGDWSRAFTSAGGMAKNVTDWRSRLSHLYQWHERLSRVQLDNRNALTVIQYWDSTETVFYLDPPYVFETRKSQNIYSHECEDDHHRALVDLLLTVKGQCVLSGYDTPIYEPLEEAGWQKYTFAAVCSITGRTRTPHKEKQLMGAARKEVIWRKAFSLWSAEKKENENESTKTGNG